MNLLVAQRRHKNDDVTGARMIGTNKIAARLRLFLRIYHANTEDQTSNIAERIAYKIIK